MSRLVPLAILVLGLATACVPDAGPSYYRDGYYGGAPYRTGYNDSYRPRFYDRSGAYGRSRSRALYEDRHIVTDYNRPGP